MSADSFFDLQDDVYVGRDPVRGPWSPDHCHAGPVAGAIARSVEHAFGPGKVLVRLTLDLTRPVPMEGFRVSVGVTRDGRRVGNATARLTGPDDRTCVTATAMAIAPGPLHEYPSVPSVRPDFALARPGQFPIGRALHDLPFFSQFIDIRYPPGQDHTPGPTQVWMRTPPILACEAPSSFQRLCPLADCGNAIARNADPQAVTFLNADLTIVAHRPSDEDWLLSDAVSHWHSNGIGLAEARLSDSYGPIATALQSIVLAPR